MVARSVCCALFGILSRDGLVNFFGSITARPGHYIYPIGYRNEKRGTLGRSVSPLTCIKT